MRSTQDSKNRRRTQMQMLARIMSDPIGREYLYDMLASCHIYSTTFAANALTMAFREGERNVGIRIGADLTEASPEMYLQMLKEAGNVRQRPEPESDTDTESGTYSDA